MIYSLTLFISSERIQVSGMCAHKCILHIDSKVQRSYNAELLEKHVETDTGRTKGTKEVGK